MKRSVRYILGGILALLGFSSCSALREAREAREARERAAFEAQQRALVEQTLQEMLEADERDPEFQAQQERERQRQIEERMRIERDRERTKLLYAVPNAPYREMEIKK